MFRRISKGSAVGLVVVLVLALAAPAWAGAQDGTRWPAWSAWSWFRALVDRWAGWEKEGICIDPAGKPCTPGGTAEEQPARDHRSQDS